MAKAERVIARGVLLVAAAAFVQVGGPLVTSQHEAGYETPPPGGMALLALGVDAIPLRLIRPVAALLTAFGATLAYASLD